jgi:hypothetical protein
MQNFGGIARRQIVRKFLTYAGMVVNGKMTLHVCRVEFVRTRSKREGMIVEPCSSLTKGFRVSPSYPYLTLAIGLQSSLLAL